MTVADFTNVLSRNDKACALINLALLGQVVIPITIITFVILFPNKEIMSSIRKKVGSIIKIFINSEEDYLEAVNLILKHKNLL
jgi:hypothetical protein